MKRKLKNCSGVSLQITPRPVKWNKTLSKKKKKKKEKRKTSTQKAMSDEEKSVNK